MHAGIKVQVLRIGNGGRDTLTSPQNEIIVDFKFALHVLVAACTDGYGIIFSN